MALNKKVYGVKTPISPRIFAVHGVFDHNPKSRKPVAAQSEIGNLGRLQLQLQFVCDKRNKFRIRGFSLGVADCVPEKSLQSVQIPSVPGHFDGMADGPLHPAGCGLEGLGYLGIQYLGDGIDHIHVVHRNGMRMPFGSLSGVGEKAAYALYEAAQSGDFISKEDFQSTAGVSKSIIESLAEIGTLDALPDTNQISMF